MKNNQRGSVFITAVIFCAAIALILGSLIALTRQTMRNSERAFYTSAALNSAESGLEYAADAISSSRKTAGYDWATAGWTISGSDATRTITGIQYSGGSAGSAKVCIVNYLSNNPTILSRGFVAIRNGATVEKWLRVTLQTRSLFPGLVVKDGLTATGGASFDSWNSDPDSDPATAAVAYSSGVAHDNGFVGAVSTAEPSISLGSSDVYGRAAVGASSQAGLAISWGGQVGPRGSANNGISYNLAAGALTTNFTAQFDVITAPSGASVQSAYVLPRNVSGPPYYISEEPLGTAGANTIIQLPSVDISGAATLTIKGNVTLIMPSNLIKTLTVGGSGKIKLDTGATLKIYTPGEIDISGAGIVNAGAPKDLQIWGTGTTAQKITLSGSGGLAGVVYAPNAALDIPGGTNLYGAVVGKSAVFSGSGAFHYDESLASFGGNGGLKFAKYEELNTPSARSAVASKL